MNLRLTQPQVELEAWAELGNMLGNSKLVTVGLFPSSPFNLQIVLKFNHRKDFFTTNGKTIT